MLILIYFYIAFIYFHQILSPKEINTDIFKPIEYTREDRVQAYQNLYNMMGIKIEKLFRKYDNLREKCKEEYFEKLLKIAQNYDEKIVESTKFINNIKDKDKFEKAVTSLEFEYNEAKQNHSIDNQKEKMNIEFQYNDEVEILAEEFQSIFEENLEKYGYERSIVEKTHNDYIRDILDENEVKIKIKETEISDENIQILKDMIENFIPKYKQYLNSEMNLGVENFLYDAVSKAIYYANSKKLEKINIMRHYCGFLRYDPLDSQLCKLLRNMFSYLDKTDMKDISNRVN